MKSSIFKNTRLALALPFVLAFAGTSFATKGDLGGDSYDGSEAKPYQISDAADLMAFAKKVNEEGKYEAWAVLTGDICMNACDEGESVLKDDGSLNGTEFTPWTPIGTSVNAYTGTFDGKEFAISGLYFNNSTANVGLFGKIGSSAVIQNVGVVDSYFSGSNYVGGVVGYSKGSVSNSYNAGTVSGEYGVGGVAGENDNTISNSYNAGSVSGKNSVGGVAGGSYGTIISNSYNTGTVSGDTYVGGVAGENENTISNSYNAGAVSGNHSVGSLVGGNYGSNVNSYFNTSGTCEKCSTNEGIGMSAEEFHSGKVAELLHDWCEKDGDNCKEGGLNGSIWGQNLRAENSLPDFSGVIGFKYGGVAFVGLKDGTAASAHIDATSNASVSIPEDITVTGSVKFKRSFSNDGHSTIMLPFTPNFAADEDTIAGVNFYEFYTYAEGKVEVTHVGQKDLKASTPYLVRAAGATELVFKNGGTFNTTTGDRYDKIRKVYKTTLANGWTVYGTYDYKTWEEGDAGLGKTYGFAGSNGYDPNVVGKFKKVGAGAYTFPMRAYLEYENPVKKVRTAPNSARAAASVTASLPETIDVVVVEKDAKTGEETTKLIGSINSRTGEFKAVDRYFDLNGRNVGKKPAAKGSFYRK